MGRELDPGSFEIVPGAELPSSRFEEVASPTASGPSDRPAGLPGTLATDDKIRRSLLPVKGMTPEQAFYNAKGTSFVPTVSPVASGLGAAFRSLPFSATIGAATEAALTGDSYARTRERLERDIDYSAEVNPWATRLGTGAGVLAQSFVPGLGIAKGATAAQATKHAATLGALYGLDDAELNLAHGDAWGALGKVAGGAALSGALTHGTGKLFAAPERVNARILSDVAAGETSARLGVVQKFRERAGVGLGSEEAPVLNRELQDNPKLTKVLATEAGDHPGKTAVAVSKRMAEIGGETKAMRAAIDEAKGGIELQSLDDGLKATVKRLRSQAKSANAVDPELAGAVEKYRTWMLDAMGVSDGIVAGETISADALRKLQTKAARIAFKGDEFAPPSVKGEASTEIWKTLGDQMAKAGEGVPGVDVPRMKDLNQRMAMWIPALAALTERQGKEAVGRTSLTATLHHLSEAGLGGILGASEAAEHGGHAGLWGMVSAKATEAAVHAGKQVGRHADYQVAKLVDAARKGSTTKQVLLMAGEYGIPLAVAEAISRQFGQKRPGKRLPPLAPLSLAPVAAADVETPAEDAAPGEESDASP